MVVMYYPDPDSDSEFEFESESDSIFQTEPPNHIQKLVKATMTFLHQARQGKKDLFVVRIHYRPYETDSDGHAMLLVGGLTSKITKKPQEGKLWLQIFDSNGAYTLSNMTTDNSLLQWVPWFFVGLSEALKKKYSIQSLKEILEQKTFYWVDKSTNLHSQSKTDKPWTIELMRAVIQDTEYDIYPNRIDINNIDKVEDTLRKSEKGIKKKQKEGRINLLDETGVADMNELIKHLKNEGICRHVNKLMALLINAVPPNNRQDGSSVMKSALNALTGPSTAESSFSFQWRRTMSMISWFIWGLFDEVMWGNQIIDTHSSRELGKIITNRINESKPPFMVNRYKSITPSKIITFLLPGNLLDPANVTYDTARFLSYRLNVQLTRGITLMDGNKRKRLGSIAWMLHNSHVLYRLSSAFGYVIARDILNTTTIDTMGLITQSSSLSETLLSGPSPPSPPSPSNSSRIISIIIRNIGERILEKIKYPTIHPNDRTPVENQSVNKVLSSLSGLLFRATKWYNNSATHVDLLMRHLRFCVQKVDRYRIRTVKMPGLLGKKIDMSKMEPDELKTSLTKFYPELSQTNPAPRYLNQRTTTTKSAFQDVFENLFARLETTDLRTPNLKSLQLECLMRWGYDTIHLDIPKWIYQGIESDIDLLQIQMDLYDPRHLQGKDDKGMVLKWLGKLERTLTTKPDLNIENYYAAWEPLSRAIVKGFTFNMVLLQQHVDLATKAGMVILNENVEVDLQLSGKPGSLFVFLEQFYMPSFSMLMDFVNMSKLTQKKEEEEEEENQ